MKEIMIYLGSGIIFGIGIALGVIITTMFMKASIQNFVKQSEAVNKRMLELLEAKVDAIYHVAAAIDKHA